MAVLPVAGRERIGTEAIPRQVTGGAVPIGGVVG